MVTCGVATRSVIMMMMMIRWRSQDKRGDAVEVVLPMRSVMMMRWHSHGSGLLTAKSVMSHRQPEIMEYSVACR